MLRSTIVPLALTAALLAPSAAGATEAKKVVKGATLTLSVPTDCTRQGSVLEALAKVKLKRTARFEVRYIEWRLDGRRITSDYSKPFDLRLATSSLEEGKSYTLEARMYTEFAQRVPKAKVSLPVSTCPADQPPA